jgi:hypothetical protein
MLDSGTVLDFNDIRKGTYVDVLFLGNVDKIILGKFNGVQYQAHAFASGICADDLKLLSLYNIRISFLQCFNSVLLLPKKKKNRTLAKSDLQNNLHVIDFNPGKIVCSILEQY